jgi:hypothetical protein
MSYEVQIKKSTKNPGFYEARYKSQGGTEASKPFASAPIRDTLVRIAKGAGMQVVSRWT